MIISHVGDILKQKGISMRELQRRTGIRFDTVRVISNDEWQLLPRYALDRLCRVLEVQPQDLFEYVDEEGS